MKTFKRVLRISAAAIVLLMGMNTVSNAQCSVFAGYDSIACNAPFNSQVMTVVPTPAGSNYTFSWSPATGLSDPNVQNPYINNVSNQQYIVTMTDTVLGCVDTDTVLWSVNTAPQTTHYICGFSPATLDFGPFGTSYNWQYYTPPAGSPTPIGVTTQTLMVNSPGTYSGYATFPYCGAITTIFTVIDSCAAPSCEVDAGPDTIICAAPMNYYQLQATAVSGSGSYTYSWSPSTGLSNPSIANPYVNDVHNQQYIVTMTDGSGCTSYDTVVVTIHNYVTGTVYMCGPSVGLSVGGAGGTFFNWGGPGVVSSDGAGNAVVDTEGFYMCVANYGGCAVTSTFTVVDSCVTAGPCSVFAGYDSIACYAPYNSQVMTAIPTPSGSNYTFSWSPATGLSDPNVQNPYINHVYNQQYVVTMTDTVTGCVSTDTVLWSVNNAPDDSINICGFSPGMLDFGPYGTSYNWQYYTPPGGSPTTIGVNTQTLMVNSPGTYMGYAVFPYCGALTTIFHVIDTCASPGNVWPGDTDYNLVAENDDFLNIGLGYGTTGATRPSASIAWTAQSMVDWAFDFSTGINYKHADTNGDGLIDYLDAQAVFTNYSMTHPAFVPEEESRSTADLYLVANYDTVGLQDNVDFALMLGNTSLPIDSIYGIAYSINYETVLTYVQPVTTYSSSWFGNPATTTFSFEKPFHTSGYIDLAYSRKNQMNVSGSGQIGNCAIVTTDNLSGIDVLHVNIYDVKAVTSSGTVISLTVAGDSVVINENFTGINDIDLQQAIGVYPNPSNGMLNVFSTYKNIESITVYNTLGETLHVVSDPGMNSQMDLSGLSNGVYIISVKTDKGSANKRITISK